jgi:hypothetical protein
MVHYFTQAVSISFYNTKFVDDTLQSISQAFLLAIMHDRVLYFSIVVMERQWNKVKEKKRKRDGGYTLLF